MVGYPLVITFLRLAVNCKWPTCLLVRFAGCDSHTIKGQQSLIGVLTVVSMRYGGFYKLKLLKIMITRVAVYICYCSHCSCRLFEQHALLAGDWG